MSGFFFCRQRKLFQVMLGAKRMAPKMVFHLSVTLNEIHHSATAGAWRIKKQRILTSVGIKQTLQQTCFTRKRKLRSKFWWLTRFCSSHDVSHFAAFFIVVGAKTSVAESGLTLRSFAVEGFAEASTSTEWVSGQLDVLSTHCWDEWSKD